MIFPSENLAFGFQLRVSGLFVYLFPSNNRDLLMNIFRECRKESENIWSRHASDDDWSEISPI